jgi:hypothetical protein
MVKEFIPYQQALALRELGFDENCFCYFDDNKELRTCVGLADWNNDIQNIQFVSAPLYQQAFRWFREKYQLYSEISVDKTSYPKFKYKVSEFIGNPKNLAEREWDWLISINDGLCREQAEAELECLRELIEIVENK